MPYIFSILLGIIGGLSFLYFPILSILISLGTVLFFSLRKKILMSSICLFFALLGFFMTILRVNLEEISKEQINTFTGYLIQSSGNIHTFKSKEYGFVKVYTNTIPQENKVYTVQCKDIQRSKNPYVVNQKNFCIAANLWQIEELKLNWLQRLQKNINRKLKESLDERISTVMIAMTTGYRLEIPKNIREDFQKTGLIHLLSISGAHFSLLFTVFFLLFKGLILLIPYRGLVYLTVYIKPSQLSIILCFPLLLFYFLLVEPNYPTTRAFIMALFFMIGVLTERKSLWITTVSFALLIILSMEPLSLKDLSFQLSFLATIAIGFVTDIYKEFKDKIKNRVISYFLLTLLISLSASFVTAPLVIYHFNYLSLISIFANITVGLLIGLVLFPLNVIFVIFYLVTGTYPLAEVINFIGNISLASMHLLASLPFSALQVPSPALGSLLIFYSGLFLMLIGFYAIEKKWKILAIYLSSLLIIFSIFLAVFLIQYHRNFLKITFLDVGQAESIVIETLKGVFLVDTGKRGMEAEKFLKAKGYRELRALIISHDQKDHAGGFLRILENFKVQEIWDNGFIHYSFKPYSPIRHLQRGDVLRFEGYVFTVLHPYREFYDSSLSKESNNLSLVFTLRRDNYTYLFTSDAGKDSLLSIPTNYLKADIIKIPHHGSIHSYSKEFYEAVNPKFCIISAGLGNPYNHPHEDLLKNIGRTCRIYRTDRDGAIQIVEKEEGLEIKTFEETRLKPYREWENLKKLFILW